MAKFFITNNAEWYDRLKTNMLSSEFDLSFDYNHAPLYALTVHKLGMHNTNAVRVDDNFCIAVGTPIYKESLDYAQLLKDFRSDVNNVRDHMRGQYAVSVYKDRALTIFGDACDCHDIYYYKTSDSNAQWIVSNSLYDMAKLLKDKISFSKEALAVRSCFPYGLLNGITFVNEIKRLQRGEWIEISSQFELKYKSVDFPVAPRESFNEMVHKTAEALKDNARIAYKVFGTPTVCATGGLDSRLLVAAYLGAGIKPILLSGERKMAGKVIEKADRKVSKMIAKKYGLKWRNTSFEWSEPADKYWDEMINNYGFTTAYVWGGQKNIIQNIKQSSSEVVSFGWGGELYREDMRCELLEDDEKVPMSTILSNYFQVYFIQGLESLRAYYPNIDKQIEDNFRAQAKLYNLNPDMVSQADAWLLFLTGMAQGDTQIPSCLLLQQYVYLILFEHNVLKYRVTTSQRKNAKFILAVINELCPSILDIPLYTRCAWHKVNKSTLQMEEKSMLIGDESLSNLLTFFQKISPTILKKKILRPIKYWLLNDHDKPIMNIKSEDIDQKTFYIPQDVESDSYFRYEILKRACNI